MKIFLLMVSYTSVKIARALKAIIYCLSAMSSKFHRGAPKMLIHAVSYKKRNFGHLLHENLFVY